MNTNIRQYDLLNYYLQSCAAITERLLTKSINSKLSIKDSENAKEISHLANVLCAIYFYRQTPELSAVLGKMPQNQRKVMEKPISIIWSHLERLNEEEIADLAIEALKSSALVAKELS